MPRKAVPKLPLSAFSPITPTSPSHPLVTRRTFPLTTIDTHVHLWDSTLTPHLRWLTSSDPLSESDSWDHARWAGAVEGVGSGLKVAVGEGDVGDKGKGGVEGFVFVQIEVEHDDADVDGSKGGWDAAIKEVDWICSHALSCSPPLLAIVPWAPAPAGAKAMESYLAKLLGLPSVLTFSTTSLSLGSRTADPSDTHSLPSVIKGFRYLLQDSAAGAMLETGFIESLKWCGDKGYTFEITIDVHRQGAERLEEVVECITRVRDGQEEGKGTRFVLCHMGKPDLSATPNITPHSSTYSAYVNSLFALSLFSDVQIKLSGLLSETDAETTREAYAWFVRSKGFEKALRTPSRVNSVLETEASEGPALGHAGPGVLGTKEEDERGEMSWKQLKKGVKMYLEPTLESFGDHRLMFGSDFPVFRKPLASSKPSKSTDQQTYEFGFELYRDALVELGVEDEGLDGVFAGNAKKWYGI